MMRFRAHELYFHRFSTPSHFAATSGRFQRVAKEDDIRVAAQWGEILDLS
jgi:hypothetical protein